MFVYICFVRMFRFIYFVCMSPYIRLHMYAYICLRMYVYACMSAYVCLRMWSRLLFQLLPNILELFLSGWFFPND